MWIFSEKRQFFEFRTKKVVRIFAWKIGRKIRIFFRLDSKISVTGFTNLEPDWRRCYQAQRLHRVNSVFLIIGNHPIQRTCTVGYIVTFRKFTHNNLRLWINKTDEARVSCYSDQRASCLLYLSQSVNVWKPSVRMQLYTVPNVFML